MTRFPDKRRRGIAQVVYCAVAGAAMGLAVIIYAMSQASIEQTINLQAAENSYITAVHVAEEARLFMAKAMDFVLQLAVEDVSSHGGLTSKAKAEGMKTTTDGVRYWRWCSQTGLPASCDNSNCGPQLIPDEGMVENAGKNMSASAAGYLADYTEAFEKNISSNKVDVKLLNPELVLGKNDVGYSSPMSTKVWTSPPGVGLDASFRTFGVVDSMDAIKASQGVQMQKALEMALAEAKALPARSAGYTYDCKPVASKTFTRKCAVKTQDACTGTISDAEGNSISYRYDCCTSPPRYAVSGSATVTDYECLVTFKVPGSVMSYTLSPGEMKEKRHTFTMAVNYRGWSAGCNTGSGECPGECYYE